MTLKSIRRNSHRVSKLHTYLLTLKLVSYLYIRKKLMKDRDKQNLREISIVQKNVEMCSINVLSTVYSKTLTIQTHIAHIVPLTFELYYFFLHYKYSGLVTTLTTTFEFQLPSHFFYSSHVLEQRLGRELNLVCSLQFLLTTVDAFKMEKDERGRKSKSIRGQGQD